jgi:hypothetical protein
MILKAILQLFLLKLVASQIGDDCEQNNEYPSYMEHPTNCSRYLVCGNGIWHEMECPARLQWNQEVSVCDWPSSAHCKLNNASSFQIDTQLPPFMAGAECSPSIERNSQRVSHHPNDCRKFLICNRKWIEMDCPIELLFSVESNHCEYPEMAKCCEKCEIKECEVDGTRLVHPDDCKSFFECKNGKLKEEKCDEDQHYDPLKGTCIEGACNNIEIISIQPASMNDLPDCPMDGILYPNFLNCKKFYICNGGTLVEQSCPPHKFYSIVHGDCEVESEAICAGAENYQENNV